MFLLDNYSTQLEIGRATAANLLSLIAFIGEKKFPLNGTKAEARFCFLCAFVAAKKHEPRCSKME